MDVTSYFTMYRCLVVSIFIAISIDLLLIYRMLLTGKYLKYLRGIAIVSFASFFFTVLFVIWISALYGYITYNKYTVSIQGYETSYEIDDYDRNYTLYQAIYKIKQKNRQIKSPIMTRKKPQIGKELDVYLKENKVFEADKYFRYIFIFLIDIIFLIVLLYYLCVGLDKRCTFNQQASSA